jgi:hypothetical protein
VCGYTQESGKDGTQALIQPYARGYINPTATYRRHTNPSSKNQPRNANICCQTLLLTYPFPRVYYAILIDRRNWRMIQNSY